MGKQKTQTKTEVKPWPINFNGHELIGVTESYRAGKAMLPAKLGELYTLAECANCGEWQEVLSTGEGFKVPEPCSVPNGMSITITLALPTGKMLVNDSLEPTFPIRETWRGNTGGVFKQMKAQKKLSSLGCASLITLDTSPNLYQTGPGNFIIAKPEYDDEGNEKPLEKAERLAEIITDEWFYNVADLGRFLELGGNLNAPEMKNAKVVDVIPGTYKFINHTCEKGFNPHSRSLVIFTHIEKI